VIIQIELSIATKHAPLEEKSFKGNTIKHNNITNNPLTYRNSGQQTHGYYI